MKLVSLTTLLIGLSVTVRSQNQQDRYIFPPKFPTPSSTFTSDSSIYLPQMESQTPTPYFPMNNINKLPFQFLASSGTKSPPLYPTAMPIYLSSTLTLQDEESEENNGEINNSPLPVSQRMDHGNSKRINNTVIPILERREGNVNLRIPDFKLPLQRIESKLPTSVTKRPDDIIQISNQNKASRRMIITSEIQKPDQVPDQSKAYSFHNPQYVQAQGVFSSTTEPAIPILRLSNEMDLDGSFSYEALGADQTHYVQHSRMENTGTDKEEQVVEGSYSYVGDNGRTYTVHYVADSNGFRATGDHLPVPPPVPEIIQRAVQYNLAEEAKRPPQLRSSWENDEREYDINERNIYSNLPTRSLFTGKTPEAFSFGFSQGSKPQSNLVTSSGSQIPVQSKNDISIEQNKLKINPINITPQVTFLASQGAQNPAPVQPRTKVSNEKPSLPQLLNYEAEIKDSDNESNKALWRWQYGLNTNMNQNLKNSISRSSGEGDDVIINFSDMTPEQYTHMMQTQVLSQNVENNNNAKDNNVMEYYKSYSYDTTDNKTRFNPENVQSSTEINTFFENNAEDIKTANSNNNLYKNIYNHEDKYVTTKDYSNIKSEIINRYNFFPQNQIATQSYNFDETSFEPSKIPILNGNAVVKTVNVYSDNDDSIKYTEGVSTLKPLLMTPRNPNKLDDHISEENSSFRPIFNIKEETTTTEMEADEIIKDNIFLRNLFKTSDKENHIAKTHIEKNEPTSYKVSQEIKHDKESKYYKPQENPYNEIQVLKPKPLDVNNVINYVVLKNHFESTKLKQKNQPTQFSTKNANVTPTHYIPVKDNINSSDNEYRLNHQQQQELQGLIKNYKVLQRQKNSIQQSKFSSEPQKHIKAFHSQILPPLGRAGPSMKSYLPPTYL